MAWISGLNSNETLTGSEVDDDIFAAGGSDVVYGLGGNDYIQGGSGHDTIYGGADDDTIFGDAPTINVSQAGINVIYGGGGHDRIWGGIIGDRLYGEGGNDEFYVRGDSGPAYYDGGADQDTIFIQDFAGWNPGNVSHVTLFTSGLVDIDHIINGSGRAAHIVTIGGSLDLTNTTLVDITLIKGRDDADNIKGHVIYDTAMKANRGAVIQGGNNNDTIVGTELGDQLAGDAGDDYAWGGVGNDTITGGTGQDTLVGGAGLDRLFGGAGNDRLFGQGGDDELTGGSEADRFHFTLNGGQDVITDFQDGVDRISFGSDITTVTVLTVQGHAVLELTGASSASSTTVLLQGVAAAQIDGSDYYWI